MNENNFSYVSRLKSCYKFLSSSRVVNRRETDPEALEYFQRFCNDTVPKNEFELQFRDTIRDLYYADKTSFLRCVSKSPYLILLTENREISEKLETDENFRNQYIKEKSETIDVPSMAILKKFKPNTYQRVRYEDDDMQSNHTISRDDTTHDLSIKNEDELWNLLLDNHIMLPDDLTKSEPRKEQFEQVNTDDEFLNLIKEVQKSRENLNKSDSLHLEKKNNRDISEKNTTKKNNNKFDGSIIRILNVQNLNINIYK